MDAIAKTNKMKNNKQTKVDDKAALRAFVMPEILPFLLEIYTEEGKNEQSLREDIKKARELYKKIVSEEKQKAKVKSNVVSSKPAAVEENQANHQPS